MAGNEMKLHRDEQCARNVATMAQLRRFDQEFTAYGYLLWAPDETVRYMASLDVDWLYRYQCREILRGSFFTPIMHLSKRMPVPSGMEEAIQLATKHALMGQMKGAYEDVDYVQVMTPFFQTAPNNSAYELLDAYRMKIDGYYDRKSMNIFWGLVQDAFAAKVLTKADVDGFYHWYTEAMHEIDGAPVPGDKHKRTLYGFVFFDKASKRPQVYSDAQWAETMKVRREKIMQGYLVGPVIDKTYYFQQFSALSGAKKTFKAMLLEDYQDILALLEQLDALPGVIDKEALAQAQNALAASPEATGAALYYKNSWNGIQTKN